MYQFKLVRRCTCIASLMFEYKGMEGITEMKIKPIMLVDSREQSPLMFENYASEPATLTTGDYSLKGMESLFSVERKSISDLTGSLTQGRERFTRELERLRGYEFRRLLIIGTRQQIQNHDYRSRAAPAAVLGSLNALEVRFNIPVVFAGTRIHAAELIEQWAFYYLREQVKHAQSIIALTDPQASHKEENEVNPCTH